MIGAVPGYLPLHARREGIQPCVYVMASRKHGTLYVGVTSNIAKRAWEHRAGQRPGFTRRYRVHLLVYYEFHQTMETAIRREKQIKEWRRAWKVELIEGLNPGWRDLFEELPF